jgi:hypothetical protein
MSEEDKVVTTATGEVPTPEKQAETATQMPEEELPPLEGFEGMEGGEEEISGAPGPEINRVITTMIAGIAFRETPQREDGKPPSPKELAAQYVEFTTPILDMIEFQQCLDAVGTLSKNARLGIGVGVLVLGLILYRLPLSKKKKKEEVRGEAYPGKPQKGPAG